MTGAKYEQDGLLFDARGDCLSGQEEQAPVKPAAPVKKASAKPVEDGPKETVIGKVNSKPKRRRSKASTEGYTDPSPVSKQKKGVVPDTATVLETSVGGKAAVEVDSFE